MRLSVVGMEGTVGSRSVLLRQDHPERQVHEQSREGGGEDAAGDEDHAGERGVDAEPRGEPADDAGDHAVAAGTAKGTSGARHGGASCAGDQCSTRARRRAFPRMRSALAPRAEYALALLRPKDTGRKWATLSRVSR